MASFIYNKGKYEILNGNIDFKSDSFKVALVTSSYTPDKDAHDNWEDITNEASGSPYEAGGKELTSKDITLDYTNDRVEFNGGDTAQRPGFTIWPFSTITARAAIIYKDTEVDSTSTLIAYIDFGQDYSTNGEDFTIEWDSEGIFYLGES